MSGVEIKPAVFRDVCFVAAHMRDQDKREIYCQLAEDARSVDVAALSYANSEHVYCAWIKGSPVAVFGFSSASLSGTVWSAWAFGTRKMKRTVPAISRFCVEEVAPDLVRLGVRRLEVRSIAYHDLAHRWLSRLGAEREAILAEWGRGGETFTLWSWTIRKWRKSHVFQSQNPENSPQTESAER